MQVTGQPGTWHWKASWLR